MIQNTSIPVRSSRVALSICLLSLLMGACGKIPKAYRGSFVDASTGSRLDLEASGGSLTTPEGRVQSLKAQAIALEELAQGKPGLYVQALGKNSDTLEIFWISPEVHTRQEEFGLVFMSAEILYTQMDSSKKDQVSQIRARHCVNGQLSVDLTSKSFNGGCPGDSRLMDFVRSDRAPRG